VTHDDKARSRYVWYVRSGRQNGDDIILSPEFLVKLENLPDALSGQADLASTVKKNC
jgi:hypothetical protein